MGLILEDIDQIVFPVFGDKFKSKVSENIKRVKELKQKSVSEYFSAENLLNDYLGVSDFDENSCAVKSLSQSFKQSGRLDAEYYLPKYDALFETLSKFTTANLGELVSIKKSIEPGSEAYQDEGIPFVRVSDVNKFGISEPSIRLSPAIVSDIESLYPRKNTILLSKDGSIGIAYKVEEDMQVVTSGALLHLTVKDTSQILPDYLTLTLNSQIVQLQAERDCNGAIIQHWKPSDIEKVRIPVLDTDKQKEISDKVQESFRLRKEAKRLLEKAIKAVETAIETDEETALKLFAL
ncbi:MAG: restriction endonuclease subunit S [Christensenellales bacterium]